MLVPPKNVIFVLGLPSSGKTTQCELLTKHFNCHFIYPGTLFNRILTNPLSPYHEVVSRAHHNRFLVPPDVTSQVIYEEIHNTNSTHFIIEGFPRTMENYSSWSTHLWDKVTVLGVINLECPRHVRHQRFMRQRPEEFEIKIYQNIEADYGRSTLPVIKHFRELNILHDINSSGTPGLTFGVIYNVLAGLGIV